MSYNYNHCTLMGRLTKDPDFKQITESFCKLTFILAVTRRYRKDNGKNETDFIPITLTGNIASVGSQLLTKGAPVLVYGSIQVRNYEKENERRWATEVLAENFQILNKKKHTSEELSSSNINSSTEESS
ncbi:MAG: single-stranded DNA-binding protein [Rickettsiales bacterium]|nr:single-stranded DNA-binding protein [Rickettsiales bacterium]